MKPSRYNNFFPFQDHIVGYNALANDYIFLTTDLHDLYTKTIIEDVNQLAEVHPDFWNLLVDKSFLVPKGTDELQQAKDLVSSIDKNPEHYGLIINPTMSCNFACWYCYESHIRNSNMSELEIHKLLKHIAKKLDEGDIKQFTLSWFGGEPLLQFKRVMVSILEFVNHYISEKNIEFTSNVTSNGLLITDELLANCKRLGIVHFQITLDGHRNRHNQVRYIGSAKRGSYDVIVANIKLCLRAGVNVTCRINLSKETFNEDLTKIIDDFSDLNDGERQLINFSFHQVWQDGTDLLSDTLDLVEEFKKHGLNTTFEMFNDFVRNSCYADKSNQATVNYNGDVFKCTARDFKTENREGILLDDGTIEWNEKYFCRMDSKFKNQACLTCRILPICNGACTQRAIENAGKEYCIYNFDEDKKTDVIRERLMYALA